MFKSGQLSLSIVAQKPNYYRNLVGNHENTFTVKDPEKEWDSPMFIQDISSPKPMVNTLAPNIEVFGL